MEVVCIRGVIASASLKPYADASGSKAEDAYPRRYCLGLIEAQHDAVQRINAILVSEALLPRPH